MTTTAAAAEERWKLMASFIQCKSLARLKEISEARFPFFLRLHREFSLIKRATTFEGNVNQMQREEENK